MAKQELKKFGYDQVVKEYQRGYQDGLNGKQPTPHQYQKVRIKAYKNGYKDGQRGRTTKG